MRHLSHARTPRAGGAVGGGEMPKAKVNAWAVAAFVLALFAAASAAVALAPRLRGAAGGGALQSMRELAADAAAADVPKMRRGGPRPRKLAPAGTPPAPAMLGPCENKHPSCEAWAARGQCAANPVYMLDDCRKACHACGADARAASRHS